MVYPEFGYFVSYLPHTVLARAPASGAGTEVREFGRCYLSEQRAMADIWQVALCAIAGTLGIPQLCIGFSTFLSTPAALHTADISVFYAALCICGTLIYLDVRSCARYVPVNRASTWLSGMAAAYLVIALFGSIPPGGGLLHAVGFLVGVIVALSCPSLRGVHGVAASPEHMGRFARGGNQPRLAMADYVARATLIGMPSRHRVTITSAESGRTHRGRR